MHAFSILTKYYGFQLARLRNQKYKSEQAGKLVKASLILFNHIMSIANNKSKQAGKLTYLIEQKGISYKIKIANSPQGLWMNIEESDRTWRLILSNESVSKTFAKISNNTEPMNLKQFITILLFSISKSSNRWDISIMNASEIKTIREQVDQTNKLYLILSDKDKNLHYPFAFCPTALEDKQKLTEVIQRMKEELEEIRIAKKDHSKSSYSILQQNVNENELIQLQNLELKNRIKTYQHFLAQKLGAVEIDAIMKQKNDLEIQAETKKRNELKQITRLKCIFQLTDNEIDILKTEIQFIEKQLNLIEKQNGNPNRLKTHIIKILKSRDFELKNCKNSFTKQMKEIQNLKKSILSAKNGQKKIEIKIKQIDAQIAQITKKTNTKEVSDRLHLNKTPSSTSKERTSLSNQKSKNKVEVAQNLVRENLLRKANNYINTPNKQKLMLKTSQNLTIDHNNVTSLASINQNKQVRHIRTSYQFNQPKAGQISNNYYNQKRDTSYSNSAGKTVSKQKQKQSTERKSIVNKPHGEKHKLKEITVQERQQNISKATKATEMLSKMKSIKAHYNKQSSQEKKAKQQIEKKITQLTKKY